MNARLGRALSAGTLRKEQRGEGVPRWVLDYRESDGTRRRVAMSTDKRVAERKRAALIRSRDLQCAGLGTEEGQERPLAELRDLYLSDLRATASRTHIVSVTAGIDRVLKSIGAVRVRDVVPHQLMQHRAARISTGTSVRTVNLEVGVFQTMMRWACRAGLIAQNPVANLSPLAQRESTKRCRRRAMSEVEIERFLAAARDDDRSCAEYFSASRSIESGTKSKEWAERRRRIRIPQAPLFRAFLEVGGRYGETSRLTWADIDLDTRVLRFRCENTKSGRERSVPLREGLCEELKALRPIHIAVLGRPLHPNDRVFLSPEGCPWARTSENVLRLFDRILDAAAIDRVDSAGRKLDLHALRHTLCSRLFRAGVGLVQAQHILGHSDPKLTSRIYAHLDAEDLRGAIEQLPQVVYASQEAVGATG